MPFREVAAAALAEWRSAEQDLLQHPERSPEWQDAARRAEAARDRYQQAVEDARRAHLPEPRPFDEVRVP